MNNICDRLRSLREERGISQEQLGGIMGVTRMTIAGYELAKRVPDANFILELSKFFKCSPNYLLGVSDFKDDDNYKKWEENLQTLDINITTLSIQRKKEFIKALNWMLSNNDEISKVINLEDYFIDRFMNVTLSFIDIFKEFANTIEETGEDRKINSLDVFTYFKSLEQNKESMYYTINSTSKDLLSTIFEHTKSGD